MTHVTYIGQTNYRQPIKFGIKNSDRGYHIYCIGKTGAGKSTLLLNMAISDVYNGNGVGLIDPHGDLAEQLLDYIPASRCRDVIYLDVSSPNEYLSFNPLSEVPPSQFHLVASSLVTTFKKIWVESWGPRLEHILRNSLITLLYYP